MDTVHLEDLRQMSYKRLCALELTQALHGRDTLPHVLIEIEELREKINKLDAQIMTLNKAPFSSPQLSLLGDASSSNTSLAEISLKGNYDNWSPETLDI